MNLFLIIVSIILFIYRIFGLLYLFMMLLPFYNHLDIIIKHKELIYGLRFFYVIKDVVMRGFKRILFFYLGKLRLINHEENLWSTGL